ncbi:Alpha/Beta hydrolase protein [Geopyxis carbonaria]|nr:Alpha/Beta hydrolase protein [Geopyxis carbonaria]
MSSTCCTSGYIQSSEDLQGIEQKVHDLDTYVIPGEPSKGLVVIIPDIFGWNLPNTRRIADTVSRELKTTVYVPDFMFGDNCSHDYLHLVADPDDLTWTDKLRRNYEKVTQFGGWIVRHREAVSWPIVNSFFEALYKENPARQVFVMGYCWGGRYACLLTHSNRWMTSDGAFKQGGFVQAAYVAHPSLLEIPTEIEAISRPTSFALGERDDSLPMKDVDRIREALTKNSNRDSEVIVYEGAKHGFAIRGNVEVESEKKNWDAAVNQAVDWFRKYQI